MTYAPAIILTALIAIAIVVAILHARQKPKIDPTLTGRTPPPDRDPNPKSDVR